MVYERVFSLGALCQVSAQIQKRFGRNLASPFDWIMTSLTGLRGVWETDGERLGLSVYSDLARTSTFCAEYGVAYQHEFTRDDDKRPIVTEEALANCRSKLLHKFGKMNRMLADNRPTLFIRMLGHHDGMRLTPYVADPRPLLPEDLNGLVDLIATKYPGLPFEVAFVYFEHHTTMLNPGALDSRVRLFPLDETTFEWFGDEKEWDKVFSAFDFDLMQVERAETEYLF